MNKHVLGHLKSKLTKINAGNVTTRNKFDELIEKSRSHMKERVENGKKVVQLDLQAFKKDEVVQHAVGQDFFVFARQKLEKSKPANVMLFMLKLADGVKAENLQIENKKGIVEIMYP